jgi:Ca-activated chloride channel family protein
MAARLAPAAAPARPAWQLAFLSAGLLCAFIAAARPQWGAREETVYQRGRDLLIVLDVSRSMLATDVHPSRLGRAKVDLLDLVKQLHGDRVGLMAFRGKPLLLCPLTTDYAFLTQTLEGVGIDSAPAGETDIGDAIEAALQTFEGDEGSHKALVLISDGEDLAGKADAAADKARERSVPIFTVGLGSTDGAKVPSPTTQKAFLSYGGQEVLSKLNNEVMRNVAEKTGGAYVPVGLANVKLGDLYRDHLSRISARDYEESSQRRYVERYQLFLLAAVACFLAAAFLSRGQILPGKRALQGTPRESSPPAGEADTPTVRDMTPAPAPLKHLAAMACLFAASALTAATTPSPASTPTAAAPVKERADAVSVTNVPPGREGARQAQQLHLLGQYERAAAAYQAAARGALRGPHDDYLFNAGCALLKAGKYKDAADCFRALDTDNAARGASAQYNLGCALYEAADAAQKQAATTNAPSLLQDRVQSLKQAGTAFQRSLRLEPENADGRRNLAVVARVMDEAVEQAKIASLMAQYGQMPPGVLADMMLAQQRKVIHELPSVFTNATPLLINAAEDLAGEQDRTSDLMIPLKGMLLQGLSQAPAGAVSNAQQQAAQLNMFAESIRDRMFTSATALRDLDRGAYQAAGEAEGAVYTLWKGVADYGQLLREDIQRQTNTLAMTAPRTRDATEELRKAARTEQDEAQDLTRLFVQRFEQSVPPEGLNAPAAPPPSGMATNAGAGSTNAVEQLITPENRKKILGLAEEAVTAQQTASSAMATNLPASIKPQRHAYDTLREIEKLLPKSKAPQQDQQQEQQQKQEDQEQQQDQQPQEQQQQKQESQPQPKKTEEQKKEPLSQEEVKRILDKIKQREKEHEQEVRERESHIPLSPMERDW